MLAGMPGELATAVLADPQNHTGRPCHGRRPGQSG
jgi:hypothetical protein